jgi:hypothetical protein
MYGLHGVINAVAKKREIEQKEHESEVRAAKARAGR